jgi:hypothetical protein
MVDAPPPMLGKPVPETYELTADAVDVQEAPPEVSQVDPCTMA